MPFKVLDRMVVLRMVPTVRKVQSRIGYDFKHVPYLWGALQAPGSIVRSDEIQDAGTEHHSEGFRTVLEGNRRLANLGDAVLRLAVVEDWYKGAATREKLGRVLSDVGSNANLNTIGRTNGLDAFVNAHQTGHGDYVGPATMATTVEAILGAVYLDSDLESVTRVMQNLGLMARLVRRVVTEGPVSEKAKSPLVSTSTAGNHEEPEIVSDDVEDKLATVLRLSQELQNSLVEYSLAVQLKQRRDENTQSS